MQADHTFSFTLRAGTGAGSATLTAQEVAGAASGTITLQLTVPARRQFEMLNPGDRPVRGYYAVYPSNLYIGTRGYGWESYATSFHHAGPDPLLSDGLTGTDNTFRAQIDLSLASYTVTVHMGDYAASRGPTTIYLNGVQVDSVPMTAAGEFYTDSYTIAQANFPSNGILDIAS